MDTEITLIIEKSYGFQIQDYVQKKDIVIFSIKNPKQPLNTNSNSFILKPLTFSKEKALFMYSMQKHLTLNNFCNTDRIIETLDNNIYIEIDNNKYICCAYPNGHQCSGDNIDEVIKSTKALAQMHNASIGFTPQKAVETIGIIENTENFESYIKYDIGGLQILFEHRTKELMRFKKQALKSKNLFDYEYLSIADKYHQIAQDTCKSLSKSCYFDLCEKYKKDGAICHKDYNSHNIFIDNDKIYITNFSDATIDIPILDLYNLIKHRMKKNNWDYSDALLILKEYDKYRSISKKEIELIKILFTFPQKLWRIVNKYYNSRRSWCEKSSILKLNDIKKERDKIEALIKIL